MPDSLLSFLDFLPVGLLLAACFLEGFVLSRRDRDGEPGVLWLLCCAAVASAALALLHVVLYMMHLESLGWRSGGGFAVLAALISLAWLLKRLARNRSLMLLRERFYDPKDASAPPRRKPWQWLLLGSYRAVLGLAALGALGTLALRSPSSVAAVPLQPSVPAEQAEVLVVPSTPVPTAAPSSEEVASLADPTRAEIPSADASAVAAMATSAVAAPPAAEAVSAAADPAAATDATAIPVLAVPPTRPVSKNSLYFSKVRPILGRHCVSCHGPQKQKGDLRLDTPDFIRAGVNGKPVIAPGVAEKSRIYHVTGLPQDDTDRMPPKGTPLNGSERAVLAEWIKSGADLGDGVSIPSGHDGVFLVDTIAANLAAPDPRLLEDLKKEHVVIRPLSKNGHVLELDFSHSDRADGDLKLSQLGPIALNIYALDFSRTKVSDADLGQLIPMKNLSRLLLSRTGISDAGLVTLRNNLSLEHLNLYETAVTDVGLGSLGALKSLKKVYLWQSKATIEGAKQLQEQVPGLVVSIGQ